MRVSLVSAALVLAVAAAACGSSLTDAQALWCSGHDMTGLMGISNTDNLVLRAADSLGIEAPGSITRADSVYAFANMSGSIDLLDTLDAGVWDELDAWRTTADYARACVAAFELR